MRHTAEHAPLLSGAGTLGVDALGLGGDFSATNALVEWNTQTLSTHARSLDILGTRLGDLLLLLGSLLLDLVLTILSQTEWHNDQVLVVESRNNLLEFIEDLAVGGVFLVRAVVHITVDSVQESGNGSAQLGDGDRALALLARNITTSGADKVAGRLSRTELQTQRNTLQLPLLPKEKSANRITTLEGSQCVYLIEHTSANLKPGE